MKHELSWSDLDVHAAQTRIEVHVYYWICMFVSRRGSVCRTSDNWNTYWQHTIWSASIEWSPSDDGLNHFSIGWASCFIQSWQLTAFHLSGYFTITEQTQKPHRRDKWTSGHPLKHLQSNNNGVFSFFSTRRIFLNHLKRRVNVGTVTLAMFDQYCNVLYKALEKHYWYLIFLAILYLKAKVSAALIANCYWRYIWAYFIKHI